MDSLDSLPIKENTILDPKEKSILEKYIGSLKFNNKNSDIHREASINYSSWTDSNKWKLIGYIVLIFIILTNSITHSIINRLPYVGGGNSMKLFITTIVIFIILITLIIMLV
jgi:hypothetical protein